MASTSKAPASSSLQSSFPRLLCVSRTASIGAIAELTGPRIAQIAPLAGWVSRSYLHSLLNCKLTLHPQLTDLYGSKWPATVGMAIVTAAFPLLIIRGPLPLFIFFLALIGASSVPSSA